MLTALPRSLLSWDYDLADGGRTVAETRLAFFPERGSITVGRTALEVVREGVLFGAFLLQLHGETVAVAEKPSPFVRRMTVDAGGGERFVVEPAGWFGRTMVVRRGDATVGSMRPQGYFSWRMEIDLPETIPLSVRVFIFWLAVVLWRRDTNA